MTYVSLLLQFVVGSTLILHKYPRLLTVWIESDLGDRIINIIIVAICTAVSQWVKLMAGRDQRGHSTRRPIIEAPTGHL